ncbi:FtsB family cell division protein [Paenarthrobacter ureafaciens]|uniref:FtsB family cell division protein n=1 Tax=Paenarthrobacter ureafaciens TaxID=37931 RepID=UPI001408979A|nr:septum formation initiator family protein [Paenarthrobacter ureafaciens]MCX8454108.1 septum formation initiator family protein [Paenarthrobacter ureafaciens]MCY0972178.1 septum formation initiator family protein [Paenarthrobacter ureafaciens]
MATRRPKVPRADALGRPSGSPHAPERHQAGGPADETAGEIIEASFGSSPSTTPAGTTGSAIKGKAAGGPSGAGAATAVRKPSARTGTPSESAPSLRGTSAPDSKSGGAKQVPGDPESIDPVPAKAFSGRLLAFAVVMIAITVMLAPTVKVFLEKRSEISALEAEIAAKEAEQEDLNKQLSRWQDPNYVKQQARDRINMVMPGETGYWVFGGEDAAGTPGGRTGSGTSENPANLPWVDALWESIRRSATD